MRLTIKAKLVGAFTFIILMLIGTAGYGIMSLSSFNDEISNVLQGPAARLELTQEVKTSILEVVREQKNLLSARNDDEIKAAETGSAQARASLRGVLGPRKGGRRRGSFELRADERDP